MYRPGPCTVGFDLEGPTTDLVVLERALLDAERRIAEEGGVVRLVFGRVRDVSAMHGGPTFVRFARAYVERTPTFERCALHVVRSFVVRTIVDPIAMVSPRVTFRAFAELDSALAFAQPVDPGLDPARLPPFGSGTP